LKRFVNQTFVSTVYVRVSDERAIPGAIKEIEALLRKRHRISPGEDDDFTVIDMKDVLSLKSQATDMIRLLGRISATVSFAIGGIGILSIMILMVNERRLEIGIRRAVGSRKRDIVWQFLMESSFISLSGGLVGIVCGFLFSTILFRILRFPFQVSWFGLVFAFVASVAVGVMAGIYPSRRAVAIQPVDVIRSA
jgi:putative ABC transport system permease protein